MKTNNMDLQIVQLKSAVDANDTQFVGEILHMKNDVKIVIDADDLNDLLLKGVENQNYSIVKLLIVHCNTAQSLLNDADMCGKIVLKGILHENFRFMKLLLTDDIIYKYHAINTSMSIALQQLAHLMLLHDTDFYQNRNMFASIQINNQQLCNAMRAFRLIIQNVRNDIAFSIPPNRFFGKKFLLNLFLIRELHTHFPCDISNCIHEYLSICVDSMTLRDILRESLLQHGYL
jgi:hypothetical protein